jgi:integrase/recombinase XerD
VGYYLHSYHTWRKPFRKVRVNLTKYIQTAVGPRYCPAVISPSGRIKQDVVRVNGKEERHAEGAYYLDWRRDGKRVRLSVGKNAVDAHTQCQRKTFELNAAAAGVEVAPNVGPNDNGQNGHRSLAAAVTEYLEETQLSKKPKTHAAYSTALAYFTESCPKLYLEHIERRDLLKFSAFLRDEKEQARDPYTISSQTGWASCVRRALRDW